VSATKLAAAQPLNAVLEREWDRDLFGKKGLATMLGWESQWTFLSKGSRAGYPDRTCCRERIIFVELKRELAVATPVTDAQKGWLDRLARAGGEVYLWRPSDLDEVGRILAHRGRPDFYAATAWLPGIGRSDTTEQQSLLTKGAA
jgi:hypothetical protein